MRSRLSSPLRLLAAGFAAGAVGMAGIKLFTPPTLEEQAYTQIVTAFEEQARNRALQDKERKAALEQWGKNMRTLAPLFHDLVQDVERDLPRLQNTLSVFDRGACARERHNHDELNKLYDGLEEFDSAVARNVVKGQPARTQAQQAVQRETLKRYDALITERCGPATP